MAWQEYKLLGFTPDLPVTTPGYLTQSLFCVATDRGIGSGPRITEDSSALAAQSLGGTVITQLDGTQQGVVGTAGKLYEFSYPTPSTLNDRSGGAYGATTTDTWSITQFGNITLAVNRNDFLQYSTLPANFAAVGAAPVPKASIAITAGPVTAPFVIVFDYNDGTNNDHDGWKCSALADATSGAATAWTASTATQCATGRFFDGYPGGVTAAIPYRDGAIAWKRGAMYLGSYTGPPNIWSWQRISGDVGCIGKNACCEANDVVYWLDDAGAWMFDGSYPRPLPIPIQKWISENIATNYAATNKNFYKVLWDKPKHLLWFLTGTVANQANGFNFNTVSNIACNVSGPWINSTGTIQAAEYLTARIIVDTNKKLGTLAYGASGTEPVGGTIAGWVITDQVTNTRINGVRPHWSVGPSVSVSNWVSGEIDTIDAERSVVPGAVLGGINAFGLVFRQPGKLDGVGSGEILRFTIFPAGGYDWEITGFSVDINAQGKS